MSYLQETIEIEESLIRAYQAELTLLQQQQSRSAKDEKIRTKGCNTNDKSQEQDHDNEDPLELIFGVAEPEASAPQARLNSNLAAHTAVNYKLTQAIQGFVLTSIERRHNAPHHSHQPVRPADMAHNISHYILQGYFQANTSVSAVIDLSVNIASKFLRGKLKHVSSRVVGMDCQLTSSKGEDLSHLEKTSMLHTQKNQSLPNWVQKMSGYLEFEQMQDECLRRFKTNYGCQSVRRGIQVDIKPKGEGLPRFRWYWDWNFEKDRLEIADVGKGDLDEKGLQDLVACTTSCDKALELILQSLVFA